MYISNEALIEAIYRCYFVLKKEYKFEWIDRDDILQEIALALILAAKRFDPNKGSWKNYSYVVARGAVKSYFRGDYPGDYRIGTRWIRREHRADQSVPWDEELGRGIVTRDHYDRLEIAEELSSYSLREKQILVLSAIGFSLSEIGSLLNIGVPMINQILGRLRIKNTPSSSSQVMDLQPSEQPK